jgi:hypothetical protein
MLLLQCKKKRKLFLIFLAVGKLELERATKSYVLSILFVIRVLEFSITVPQADCYVRRRQCGVVGKLKFWVDGL